MGARGVALNSLYLIDRMRLLARTHLAVLADRVQCDVTLKPHVDVMRVC